jgi:hypothetical protein
MKHLICIIGIFLLPAILSSQIKSQTIRGTVVDKQSKELLIGATVQVIDISPPIGNTTDINGEFVLRNVPIGRIRLRCDYLGYTPSISPSFLLNSAKEAIVEFEMLESAVELNEVIISAEIENNRALNEMAVLSARSFSVEETERYAGSIADPSRMAASFAGVQTSNDLNNDIVVRGNSSVGVLWRLEGVDIPNPNHFARRGSSGGGISIFSVNMISNSDFIYGVPPPEYGNSLSSIFDMRLRKGNRERNEYSFRAGLLGLDLVAEGPIKKGESSYLVNFRYSTLGILNKMGVYFVNPNTDNTFTDLAFHLHLPSKNNKNIFQIWGIGGYSSEIHNVEPEISEWKEFDNLTHTDFITGMGAMGLNYTRLIDDKSYIKAKLAFMGDHITHAKDTVNLEFEEGFLLDESYTTTRINAGLDYSRKVNSALQIKAGVTAQLFGYDLYFEEYDRYVEKNLSYIDQESSLGDEQMFQSYLQGVFAIGKIEIHGGIHMLSWSLGENFSMEPRLSLVYKASSQSSISIGGGINSQIVPLGAYYSHANNLSLDLLRSEQLVAAYNRSFSKGFRLNIEAYYQRLKNVPVATDSQIHYWMLNDLVGFSEYELSSVGLGRNYGVDLTFEKVFDNGYFLLAGFSLYESEYSINGDAYFNSRYAGKYNTSLMIAREKQFDNGNSLQLGFRNLLFGGQWYQPPDDEITQSLNTYYEDLSSSLTLQNKMYWRSDLRIAYRKNMKGNSWTVSLDIQNLFNRLNTRNEFWNFALQEYEARAQTGIIPVISYQVDF